MPGKLLRFNYLRHTPESTTGHIHPFAAPSAKPDGQRTLIAILRRVRSEPNANLIKEKIMGSSTNSASQAIASTGGLTLLALVAILIVFAMNGAIDQLHLLLP